MPSISYSSKYKFLASLGLFLIVFPFILVYTYTKNLDSFIKYKDYTKINEPEIIELLKYKQSIYLFVKQYQNVILFFLVLIILFGVALLVKGLSQWNKYQVIEFEKLNAELEQLKNKNSKLVKVISASPEEEDAENIDDFGVTCAVEEDHSETADDPFREVCVVEEDHSETADNSFREIENRVYHMIDKRLSDKYTVIKQGILSPDTVVDIIAISGEENVLDELYEIECFNDAANVAAIERGIAALCAYSEIYYRKTEKRTHLNLIVVTNKAHSAASKKIVDKIDKRDVDIEIIDRDNIS